MDSGIQPIDDGELLYRRVPTSMDWYDPMTGLLKSAAFGPHKTRDITGLSVFRKKYKSIKEAASGQPGKSYFVAVLRAGDLRHRGIDVVPCPNLPDGQYDLAHAELPGLNSSNRKDGTTLENQRILATDLCLEVEGPFATPEIKPSLQ